ncbi:hypothetical protein GCM10010304_77560 [Streptomyces roseoviolaceus]
MEEDLLIVHGEHHDPVVVAVGLTRRPRLVQEQPDIDRADQYWSRPAGSPQAVDGLCHLAATGALTCPAE